LLSAANFGVIGMQLADRGPDTGMTARLLVLAIGEAHQLFHVLGPALHLHRMGIQVNCIVSTHWHEKIIWSHAPELGPGIIRSPVMFTNQPLHKCPPRLLNLLSGLQVILDCDAILTPERTSTLLRRFLGKRCPKLIHIPHGAGDRAKSYDSRIGMFDLVLVAGTKDRDMLVHRGIVSGEKCHVVGYCKFDLLPADVPDYFDNELPTVLYNPHFDDRLSSWPAFGEAIIRAFSRNAGMNLICAPHVRMRGRSRQLFDRLASQYASASMRFDGGSLESINMNYTRYADIYLGDVSSQVYEFLRVPKPCVFANAHAVDWQADEHYRHWHYGEVANSAEEVLLQVASAIDDHPDYAPAQTQGFGSAIEETASCPSRSAASAIHDFLSRELHKG
jgi:hypothetical protein